MSKISIFFLNTAPCEESDRHDKLPNLQTVGTCEHQHGH